MLLVGLPVLVFTKVKVLQSLLSVTMLKLALEPAISVQVGGGGQSGQPGPVPPVQSSW